MKKQEQNAFNKKKFAVCNVFLVDATCPSSKIASKTNINDTSQLTLSPVFKDTITH